MDAKKRERKNAHIQKEGGRFFPSKKASRYKKLSSSREQRGAFTSRPHNAFLENTRALLIILMVEGRPKRACADGIDYAGTDQVPGWTVRETRKLCFHFSGFVLSLNIFEIIRERKRMRGQSRSSLSRSVFSLSLSFRCGRCSENNQKGRERRLKATDETRALRLSLSLSL